MPVRCIFVIFNPFSTCWSTAIGGILSAVSSKIPTTPEKPEMILEIGTVDVSPNDNFEGFGNWCCLLNEMAIRCILKSSALVLAWSGRLPSSRDSLTVETCPVIQHLCRAFHWQASFIYLAIKRCKIRAK